jgi:hypothetical protein
MLQIVASLTDNSSGVIYDRNIFIILAIGLQNFLHSFSILHHCKLLGLPLPAISYLVRDLEARVGA